MDCTLPEKLKKVTGGCCCECKYQIKIFNHPDFEKGKTMLDIFGYGCSIRCFGEDENTLDVTIFSKEELHSTCEMFEKRED